MNYLLNKWAILSAIVGLLASCQTENKQTIGKNEVIPVTIIHPTSIEFPRSYVADIQAIQFVEIKPKVEGYVQQVLVDEGQLVKKGQPLFKLSSENYAEAVKEAEANYQQALVELEMANYEADRVGRLVEKDIISPIRLKQVQKQREVISLKVEQALANRRLAQMNYSYTTITSPFTGYIDRIPYKVGSLVSPNSLLTTVSDISEIFAYYKVNESEYLQLRRAQLKGEKNRQLDNIELILPDGSIYPHRGVQEAVEGDFERGTGSIAFRVRFPNPERLLKHGVTGKIRMLTSMENISLIPQKSTFEIQDFTYVYTVDSTGTAKVRSFTPIERYNNYYVTQDFEPGTTIIYEGVQMIRDGMKIKNDTLSDNEIKNDLHLSNLQK